MSSISIGKDSFFETPSDPNVSDGIEKIDLQLGYVAGNSAIRGQLAASDAKWDKSKTSYVPTKMVFGGRLERRADGNSSWVEFLRGGLTLTLSNHTEYDASKPTASSNPQRTKADLGLVLTIPTRPILNVSLILNSTDTGLPDNAVTMTGQYKQGSSTINISGDSVKGTLVMESAEGVKLSFDQAKTVHPMTKSDFKVGEFNSQTNRLTYADGTFEQF
jgi:hypothetical protein